MADDGAREAIRRLRRRVRRATAEQRRLGAAHGLRIATRAPYLVAGAQLRDALDDVLAGERAPATDGRLEYLADLAADAGLDSPPQPGSADEARAWLDHLLTQRTLAALLALRPAPGDVIYLRQRGQAPPEAGELDPERVRMISSIDQEGRLHFRGAGQRAWPDSVELLRRADADGKQADDWRDKRSPPPPAATAQAGQARCRRTSGSCSSPGACASARSSNVTLTPCAA
jgi:hypothetical protein